MAAEEEFVPEEIEDQCTECHEALAAVERLVKPVLTLNRSHLVEKLSPLDRASLILMLAYTMNSLFWVYLAAHGINPKTHLIKGELERIQKAMKRMRSVSEMQSTAGVRLNKAAAKRFVRGALWDSSSSVTSDQEVHTADSSHRKRKNSKDLTSVDIAEAPRTKKTHIG